MNEEIFRELLSKTVIDEGEINIDENGDAWLILRAPDGEYEFTDKTITVAFGGIVRTIKKGKR